MKNKNSFIPIVLLMFGLSSCNDFLDVPSETNLTSATFFSSQTDFEKAVNGAYMPLRGLYASGANAATGSWLMGETHSDNTRYKYSPNYRATIDQENINDFMVTPTNTAVLNKWQGYYSVIARANQILATIDGVTFDAAKKSNLKGQALFLRAFSYFDLVQYFGKIPLHLVPATSLTDVSLPLSEVNDIYNQIIADATEAASLLPAKSAQEAGRATSGAAKTLLGNVHIVLKNWSAAESVLKEVVNSAEYSLVPNYADVFSTTNKNNSESVFEIQFRQGTDGYSSNFIYAFFPMPISATELTATMAKYGVAPAALASLTQEGYNIPTTDLIADYEAGDERLAASIGTATASGVDYPFILKYLHPHTTATFTDDNWPVYRYSEVLLFLAEALDEQGKSTEALPYLNEVRDRAGLDDVISAANLRDVIFHERRVELAFENKRWLDLARTGRAVDVISAFGAKVKANPQGYYFPAGQQPVPASFATIDLTFPLPAAEAQLSPYF
ncbi:SusD family protein [Chryseolinea serpens]|uniref:SusD family protein n=1 Tax=Chryseolinea serpens TaxID=947013 RepID=A0A1M5TCR6_9BACT|nr:RagB/SusD family nutrient uptake outer membrane protein [Chryseolinea serpens]SHH48420.1 SusD family protein [Chryseolinea serpens]